MQTVNTILAVLGTLVAVVGYAHYLIDRYFFARVPRPGDPRLARLYDRLKLAHDAVDEIERLRGEAQEWARQRAEAAESASRQAPEPALRPARTHKEGAD